MTVLSPISYVLRWSLEAAVVPVGAGSMEVPCAQRLKISQGAPSGGGMVTVPSTGLYPSAANFSTAIDTVAVNMKAALETTTNLSQMQGWATGGG